MPILVKFCYQLVLYGMSWEVCPPLRIRYAPPNRANPNRLFFPVKHTFGWVKEKEDVS